MQLYLRKQLSIAGIIYIGQMLVGLGMGWTAPVLPKLQDPEQSPLPNEITGPIGSWIASLLYIGCIIGPYISGYFSNIIGRKPCLLIGGIITAFSFVLVIFTRNLAMIFAVRIIKGFGIGIIAVGNIVYIGEISSKNIRGILLTAIGIASTLGTLIIYAIGPYVSYAGTGWLGLGLTLMFICSVLAIPESPIFYVITDREDEAKRVLISIGRFHETDEVLATKIEKREQKTSAEWKELFTVRSNRRALIMLLILNIFQQLSGVVAMLFYTTNIFELAGSSVTPHIATIIIGVTQLGSSCLTPLFVEWSGRKTLLLLSTAVCGMSLVVLGTYFYFAELDEKVAVTIGWLPLLTLIIFFMFYDFGFGIIPGTLTGEMFRSNVRSTGSAITATTAWIVGFGVSFAFGYMIVVGMHFIFWFFAASCACACIFTVFYVPETKGKSLIEIQEMLEVLLRLPRYCSASGMFADAHVDGFHATLRKRCAAALLRVRASHHSLLTVVAERWDSALVKHWTSQHLNLDGTIFV